jgi:transcriptional regulator with XRE-family HTH domain
MKGSECAAMTSAKQQIVDSLSDKEYRDLFVSEHISQGLAFQIRALRQEKGWTQSELGERVEMRQTTISQLEDPDYGRFTLSTLKRLASAFDVALMVRFTSFHELIESTVKISPARLAPPSFDEDRHSAHGTYYGYGTTEDSENAALLFTSAAFDFDVPTLTPATYAGTSVPSPKELERVAA